MDIHEKYWDLFKLIDPERAHELEHVRYVFMTGSRGSGKSVALSTFLNGATYMEHFRILFTRYTMTSAETSIIPEFREKCEWLGNDSDFYFKRTEVVNQQTGNEIIYRGLKPSSKTANSALKSVNGVNVFVLEEAEECTDEDLFDKVDFSIRTTLAKNLVIICMNPCDVNHWIYKKFYDKDGNKTQEHNTLYIHTTYLDNIDNLDEKFLANIEQMKLTNPAKYRHQFLGEWTQDVEGALWTQNIIDAYRVTDEPEMRRIVVAVDPAVTDSETSDETGIIVAGIGIDGKYYVLDDYSLKASPKKWAEAAISAYKNNYADRVIGEVNNGGDMIELTLQSVDKSVSYKAVRASRGKITRAEPVAALYEQGKVHHVGVYETLELEMTTYKGASNQDSPNRFDALVWAITELMGGSTSMLDTV